MRERIAGATAAGADAAAMARELGAGAQLLAPGRLVADADRCWLDGDEIADEAAWRRVLEAGRLAEVEGAFALAWIDAAGALHLARDPLGHRSIYFALAGAGAVFASTLHGVMASGLVPRRLRIQGIAEYLSFAYVPGTETLLDGVLAVRAGETVRIAGGAIERTPFWRLPAEVPDPLPEADLRRLLRAELEAAVRRRLPPRGETAGATLSGGIDSSAVVALMRRLHEGEVRCWSVSFGRGTPNELEWSAMVARHCGIEQEVVEISPRAVMAELDRTMGALSEPNGDPLTVPNTLLFRAAAKRCGAVFNGEGGDPCFGGPKNAPMLLSELFGDERSRETSYVRAHHKCWDHLAEMFSKEALAEVDLDAIPRLVSPWFEDARWPSLLNKLTAVNVAWKGAHHILPKVEHLSAIEGVLPRSPLFDRRLVELSFSIPPNLKRHGAVEKHLLKEAVADLLPRAILERPKSGMLVPVEGWFQKELLPFARERALDGLSRHRIFDAVWLERLLLGRLDGIRPRRGAKIWLLVALESWLRRALPPS